MQSDFVSKARTARLIFKVVAVLVSLVFLGVIVLLGVFWLEHGTEVTLPTPTGSFAVGRVNFAWADGAHIDTLAPVPGTRRELVVWLWYPSLAGQSNVVMDDYLPAAWRAADERARGILISKFLTRDLSLVRGHSISNADVSPQQRSYPLVILRSGASGSVTDYSTLAEDLASHGYIVAGFDAPYRTRVVVFPDGRVMARTPDNDPDVISASRINELLAAWTADTSFVLDQLERLNKSDPSGKFTGRLDLTRVGIFGHSLGGATAAQFCHQDSRCKAGIDVDGAPMGSVIQEGIHQPFMFLLSDHSQDTNPESRQIKADIQSIYARLPPDGRLRVMIRGGNHFSFSDDAVLKSHILRRTLSILGMLRIDGRRQLDVTTYCVHSFFDAHLKGPDLSQHTIASPFYPEIQILD
jgi:predicted dienelactone hydrolase